MKPSIADVGYLGEVISGKPRFWTPRRWLLVFCAGWLAGLALAKWGISTNFYLWSASLASLLLLTRQRLVWLAVALVAVNLGIWRGQAVLQSFFPLSQNYEQVVKVSGRVSDDPAVAEGYQTEFHLDHLQLLTASGSQPSGGRLRIRGFPYEKLNRGDTVVAEGKLRTALGNRQGQISYGKVTLTGQRVSWLESLRRRFFAGIYTSLPEPQASLGLGFLVGLRSLLPENLLIYLAATGLTHIVAVSGYNLTILVRFIRRLLAKHSKYWALAGSVGLLALFLAVTGLSPSIFRASLVAGLALAAWYYGRPIKPSVLILIPAAVTAGISPTYLWGDIGWYLSFLAFFGVLVVAPSLMVLLRRKGSFSRLLLETLSAQILTLPLIIYIFQQASVVAPLANLIILPLIPFAMLLSFMAGLGGMLLPALAGWVAWPANSLLTAMTYVIERLGSWPAANKTLAFNFSQLLMIYGLLFGLIWLLRRRHKPAAGYSIIK